MSMDTGYPFKLFLKRDEQTVRFHHYLDVVVIRKLGRLFVVSEEIDTTITHGEEGVLSQIQFVEDRYAFMQRLLFHCVSFQVWYNAHIQK
ncbi:hypothetical protein KSF_073270 [Reticulibacter mediterranei]|uniref:Uncharacterized protein n=1 Tax=Reticulibacter mediterranei TaxID=2778369 RepID=A0A8J3ISW4_9CHLR|nr:hypothetical protein KSF_073270 [Reticulibacter mediterranei]